MSLFENVNRRGTRASQPAASAVIIGCQYYVTDENVTERSNGTIWQNCSDVGGASQSELVSFEFDDFIVSNNDLKLYKFEYFSGAADMAVLASVANHPGIMRQTSTGGATNRESLAAGNSFLPADTFEICHIIRTNSHTNSHYYAGAWGDIALPPSNGIYLESLTTDTNWFLVTRASGTQTRVDTGVACTNSGWFNLKVYRKDGTTIGAKVNGSAEVTSTTNIPTAVLSRFCGMSAQSGTQSYDLDYWHLKVTVTR